MNTRDWHLYMLQISMFASLLAFFSFFLFYTSLFTSFHHSPLHFLRLSLPSLFQPLPLLVQYYPARRVTERLNTFSFNVDLPSVVRAVRSFCIHSPEISSAMLEGTSRFVDARYVYVRSFLHEMEFVAGLLDPSKCLPTDCTV